MSMRLTHEQFVARARSSHGNKYEYPEPYVDMKTPLLIICQKHGEFIQSPDNHIAKSNPRGCKRCGIIRRSAASAKTDKDFLNLANSVHGQYEYPDRYISAHEPIRIICRSHGLFTQTPHNHTQGCGKGCPTCAEIHVGKCNSYTTEDWIALANIEHNYFYDYICSAYVNSSTNIMIRCPIHGQYLQKPSHHLYGHGCPNCTHIISKPSNAWLDSIGIPDGPETREVRGLVDNKRYTVDGYDPATNTIFEFHGDYYHGHPDRYNPNDINPTTKTTYGELYERTQRKKQIFLDAGYKYVEMWESDWKRYVRNQ